MSAQPLREAVTHVLRGYVGVAVEVTPDEVAEAAAAAAIRVVLAEATRSIEVLRDEPHTTPPCRRAHDADDAYGRALAVLAALGEHA